MSARCATCPHGCQLAPGPGACRARTLAGGAYGRMTSLALDPYEKKPFACWRQGEWVLSCGSYGCNMSCPWCQNASISCAGEHDVAWQFVSPKALVDRALDLRAHGCTGLAFTYNEPLIAWEYVRDASRLAHVAGLATCVVSNGMATAAVLDEVLPHLDAANIDLKAFNPETYRLAGGSLACVQETIQRMAATPGFHLEVTTLIIPGLNDSEEEIDAASAWLARLNPEIPYHVTAFHPCHRMQDRPATSPNTVRKLAQVARRHLNRVFTGNI
ncbi:MAG: AmmeMemoRadiSam system radical SAM enzyme [Coriobacteriia bacterium]|nr:AmmeMemoRadiSam system radical SAM enzyme [Coriobacteriia bacterium]